MSRLDSAWREHGQLGKFVLGLWNNVSGPSRCCPSLSYRTQISNAGWNFCKLSTCPWKDISRQSAPLPEPTIVRSKLSGVVCRECSSNRQLVASHLFSVFWSISHCLTQALALTTKSKSESCSSYVGGLSQTHAKKPPRTHRPAVPSVQRIPSSRASRTFMSRRERKAPTGEPDAREET